MTNNDISQEARQKARIELTECSNAEAEVRLEWILQEINISLERLPENKMGSFLFALVGEIAEIIFLGVDPAHLERARSNIKKNVLRAEKEAHRKIKKYKKLAGEKTK